jgi:hypothetical protein
MRKFTFNANQTTAQQEFVAAANLNPRKPYYKVVYRNDILRFADPSTANTLSLQSIDSIPFSYQALDESSVLIAGYDSSWNLRAGTTAYETPSLSSEPSIVSSGYEASTRGTWSDYSGSWRYYYVEFVAGSKASPGTPVLCSVNASGSGRTTHSQSGLPTIYKSPGNITVFDSVRRPSAFLQMSSGDKIVVYTSYELISNISQYVCTMNFYYAPEGSTQYKKMRTTIQYNLGIDYVPGRNYNYIASLDPTAGNVFAYSNGSGDFFVIANDGTKAIRFAYKNGIEGMAEPIIPIDIDANRLEITDSEGKKSYGKYHQFLPHHMTKIGDRHYLNGQMIRTYSNGDQNLMEVYLWSIDGNNWSIGDVSFFIDSSYYKKSDSVRKRNYCLVHPDNGQYVYALGNNCWTKAEAREMDNGSEGVDFSDIVISGKLTSTTNSTDQAEITVMKGFGNINPDDVGGKTITLELGYYDSSNVLKSLKMGEYFVDSESYIFSTFGRGPNGIQAHDSASWKLTRWSSITDIDRWSSTFVHDEIRQLSKMIVKGITSGYKAVDNKTGSGLYLSNLNDPFIGYTSTRDDRDGMFTACVKFADTGSNARLSSFGFLIGAEDYTDIYRRGRDDRKGFNVCAIPCQSSWTGHSKNTTGPQMLKSRLKRRWDDTTTPEDETDTERAFVWTSRYTSFWERGIYTTGTDNSYNNITEPAATGSEHVIKGSSFYAVPGTDYEFVMRRHSGRIQIYSRKKGMTPATIAASTHNEYELIYEYQFGKDDRIDWGPRPYWGIAANTDVFATLEGWNSREYNEIESTLSDARESARSFSDFPNENLASIGIELYEAGTGHYVTVNNPVTKKDEQQWVSGTSNYYGLIQKCVIAGQSLKVGDIVRCYVFTDNGVNFNPPNPAVNLSACTVNIIRDQPSGNNVIPRAEFIGIIGEISDYGQNGDKLILFSKTWPLGSGLPTPGSNETYYYTIYKVGNTDYYAFTSSTSQSADVVVSLDGTTSSTAVSQFDIKAGSPKQSEITAGRGAFINRQNDAIAVRMVESDGVNHTVHSGSSQTGLGFDYPTNPIREIGDVNNPGYSSTRDWRLLLYQGRLFPFSATVLGLPAGTSSKSYMIKGQEVVRYMDMHWASQGGGDEIYWCVIPTYYTPIFPSVKGSTTIQQWSKSYSETVGDVTNSGWIEPGDAFNGIPMLEGLRVYLQTKDGYFSLDGEENLYAKSATASNGSDTASILTLSAPLKAGAESMSPSEERAKDADAQVKEIAIVSGRTQFNTGGAFQDYSEPLCFYPVGPAATAQAEYFIKVKYCTMNAGLYNSSKENLKYVCNLAGVSDVQFMDISGSIGNNSSSEIISTDVQNFVIEASAAFSSGTEQISVVFRDAYRLIIEPEAVNDGTAFGTRSMVVLTLQTIPGFAAASEITTNGVKNSGIYYTIAKVSVPVSDIVAFGSHDFKVIVKKERVSVEVDHTPVWTFNLKTYKYGGTYNEDYDLFTDAPAPVSISVSSIPSGISYTVVELSEEVENQVIDMAQGGGDAVRFITQERHIHARSTQDGGIQFGRFLDLNRQYPATGASLRPTTLQIRWSTTHLRCPGTCW